MKKFIAQAVLLLLVIGLALVFFNPNQPAPRLDLPFLPRTPHYANLKVNEKVIKVELVDTAEKRKKGLSGRNSLGEFEGMLFVFEKADKYPFWMKGLSFSLDFVWIGDNKVKDILQNIPPPQKGQSDSSLPIYSSNVEIDKVLELPAGTVEKLNIKVNDTIKLTPL